MKAAKCPKEELSLTDWAFVNPEDFNDSVKSVFFFLF
jgi:vesicle-fusing ATPase